MYVSCDTRAPTRKRRSKEVAKPNEFTVGSVNKGIYGKITKLCEEANNSFTNFCIELSQLLYLFHIAVFISCFQEEKRSIALPTFPVFWCF